MDAVSAKIIMELCFGKGWDEPKFTIDDIFDFFKKEERLEVKSAIKKLERNKFLKQKQGYEGSVLVSLSERGMLRALNLMFRKFDKRKENWDGSWRMIAFDIPEHCTKGRKALVYRLKSGGFYKLRKSLFLYPFDCEQEVKILAKLFKIEKHITFGLMGRVDGQERIIKHFKLAGNFIGKNIDK